MLRFSPICSKQMCRISDIQNWIREKNIFFNDRGFSGRIESTGRNENKSGNYQFHLVWRETEDANLSRPVTKIGFHQYVLISITDPVKLSITINATWFSCMQFYLNLF